MKDINRRDFLKLSGAVAATTAIASCGGGNNAEGDFDPSGHHTGPVPTDKMTYRTNPKQGDKVSILGYGWMRLPMLPLPENADPNNPPEEQIDQEQCNRLAKYALDHGVNYFDTSPVYTQGKSEASLGTALKASGYDRSKFFIATKLSNFSKELQTYEKGVEMFQNSLRYLQTDYVDYLLLHALGGGGMNGFRERYIDNGLLDYLVEQREKGTIRNLGFSYHGDNDTYKELLALNDKYHWDFVQIQMNYVDWNHSEGHFLYEELEKLNIPAVIMEPLLGGRLAKLPDHVVAHLKQRAPENSVASWAFRYCGTKPGVMCVLSGMTYMEHLEDNIRSFSPLEPLTTEDVDWLEGETANLIVQYPTIPCNDCKYCMPCPYGLDIPAIFVHYNKCINKGYVPESREAKNYKQARQAFLVGYDRSVPKLRQANHCVGCQMCVKHCPQNIRIPAELRKIDQFVEKLKTNTL
ncbi:MAG: aldo/keto reductase [Bacteroidaceae bacterium]|nr:aldo/keto reductase [Bacteroidaceae bacterium]